MHMYTRNIIILLISFIIYNQGYTATCEIESGPPPLLSAYLRETKAAAQSINTRYSENLCTNGNSPITSLNRSLSTLDKAGNQVPIMNNLVTDFSYNVISIYRLDIPPMVLSHGNLLYSLEKNTLIPTLDTLASRCQLDGSAEGEMIALIQRNNHIQDVFKWVTTWTIASSSDPLEQEIYENYNKQALTSCKSETDMSVAIEKITEKKWGFWSDITIAIENWKASMALLSDGSTNSKQSYAQLQKQLLDTELSRQWLSQEAKKQIMSNLDCIQKEALKDTTFEWTRARAQCIGNPLIGYKQLESAYEDLKFGVNRLVAGVKEFFDGTPTNTDEFITLSTKIDKVVTEEKSILMVYADITASAISLWDEESTTNSIITNLVGIHTSLVGINWLLEKRIPKIQEDCMKWSPWITGACYTE